MIKITASNIKDFLISESLEDVKEYHNPKEWIKHGIVCTTPSVNKIPFLVQKMKKSFKVNESGSKEWIIITFKETEIHIFTKEAREYYTLDDAWESTNPNNNVNNNTNQRPNN